MFFSQAYCIKHCTHLTLLYFTSVFKPHKHFFSSCSPVLRATLSQAPLEKSRGHQSHVGIAAPCQPWAQPIPRLKPHLVKSLLDTIHTFARKQSAPSPPGAPQGALTLGLNMFYREPEPGRCARARVRGSQHDAWMRPEISKPSQVPGYKANSPHPGLQVPSASLHPSEEAGNSLPLPRVPHLSTPYLFTQRRPPRALGLLVALGQGAVAGAQSFAGGIVYLHGNPLCGPFLRIRLHVDRLFIPQKVFKPSEQLWEFPENKMNEVKKQQSRDQAALSCDTTTACYEHMAPKKPL